MKKIISRIMIITILLSLSLVGEVFARYEASSATNPKVSATADAFFDNIRQMEAEGGTLGLKANIDTGSEGVVGTYTDSSKNGLDCHMIKNTEWGPIVMLSASQYGQVPSSGTVSSTGNATGVYHLYSIGSSATPYCYVVGVWKETTTKGSISKILGADPRYRDEYTTSTGKIGDATTETAGWYSGYRNFVNSSDPVFSRGERSLFGYDDYAGGSGTNGFHGSRAVVVCGAGL